MAVSGSRQWALAAQYQDPSRMSFHQIVVDTYAVQHPDGDDPRAIQPVGIHLMTLCLFLERGTDPALGTRLHRLMVERPVFHWLAHRRCEDSSPDSASRSSANRRSLEPRPTRGRQMHGRRGQSITRPCGIGSISPASVHRYSRTHGSFVIARRPEPHPCCAVVPATAVAPERHHARWRDAPDARSPNGRGAPAPSQHH